MTGPLPLAPWPHYDDEQIEAVAAVLRSGRVNYWTGEHGRSFEREYAARTGVDHAIAVANGTLALELALVALQIGAGDEVIVPARSFVGSASCVLARGARPVFADIDPVSHNVTAETVAAAITPRTRAVIVVHLSGWPCNMPQIVALARRNHIAVIEDCAQAHGGAIDGRAVGSFGDLAAFSFCQDKIISTGGEGGMLLCRDETHWARAWSHKDHGKTTSAIGAAPGPGYRWVHDTPGSNWRMTECQAVLGRLQLKRLDEWVAQRAANAAYLASGIGGAVSIAQPPSGFGHAYYRLAIDFGGNREALLTRLQRRGVPASVGVCPEIYRERAFENFAPRERLPGVRHVGARCLFLPVHPTLTRDQLDFIRDTFVKAVTQCKV